SQAAKPLSTQTGHQLALCRCHEPSGQQDHSARRSVNQPALLVIEVATAETGQGKAQDRVNDRTPEHERERQAYGL
ncbi:hypothetical protein, partial [Rhizobium sp. 9140]|uniref:hypothetical protein n=1 Tax=Rhizobium sp. 9140 TaxID=1761900 RepID=UPI001FDA9928